MSESPNEPNAPEGAASRERADTNASLKAERIKTDDELGKAVVEKTADRVVEVARERAEATLRMARQRADRDMEMAGVGRADRREIAVERAAEDGAVAEENAAADTLLHMERESRRRALRALLRLEREATDDGLVVERARADEAVATRDEFLGIVSHDLRNMLGGMALSAQTLAKFLTREGEQGAATLKHADRIQRFTARMNRLVGDLIDVVSLEAGKLHVTLEVTNAIDLVKDAVEAFQPSFAANGITLGTHIGSENIAVNCDHERIIQVLANLLNNALRFTERGGKVTLAVVQNDREVGFSVTDNGSGIPEGQMAVIFERFKQVGPKQNVGLGLGLYIAKCIVDAHGGSIWAESPTGGGARVIFTLLTAGPTLG